MNNRNALPPSLVANLQQVLTSRKPPPEKETINDEAPTTAENTNSNVEEDKLDISPSTTTTEEMSTKPVILVTNGDGVESPGLLALVDGLVRLANGKFLVHVCAPHLDKSVSGHSMTVRETLEVTPVEIAGVAAAFQVTGTPADCVSLALSQTLFSWSKPVLVISGINRGSSCGQNMLYSGAIAGAREALISGVPSLCISLDWKKDVSSENDFKDAVDVCLPLVEAAVRDIENGTFPVSCLLSVEIPACPSSNKGFRSTRQSLWRSGHCWRAVSSYKHPAALSYMANQQSLGLQLAQLGRDASAAGAARRLNTSKKNVEIESVGVAGKPNSQLTTRKHFRLEFSDEDKEDADEDLDFKAVQNGYVAVTPLALSSDIQCEISSSVSNWLSSAFAEEQ